MPERWERELQTLRRAGPRADLWPRVEEGPHGSPSAPPSGRKRLLAGGVAFAVFVAAGLFAWNAFQPAVQEGLPPRARRRRSWRSTRPTRGCRSSH